MKRSVRPLIIITHCQCGLTDLLLRFYDVPTPRVCRQPNCTLWQEMKELLCMLGKALTLNHGSLRLIQHKPAETGL